MKRAFCSLLLVFCVFNCAASSFAEENVIYEEPTEGMTVEELIPADGEELIVEPETETLVEPESFAPAGLLDESDILIPQQHPENDIMPEQTQEESLMASDSFSADETATPAYQDLTLDLGVNGDSYESGFVYNDSFLLKANTTMSPELAKASIALASSAYVTVGDPPSSLYSALEKMGYTVDKADGNWNRTHMVDDNDFVRYVIATKPIMDGDVEHIVYCLVIQGTRGGYDWDSDFNIGTEDDHYGFYTAREEIVNKLCDMMEHDGKSSSERILWTMGHSRGAAVSNIVAGEFTMGHSEAAPFSTLSELIHGDRIYSYNFACPSVSKRDDVRQAHMNGICPNIFNFNSPHDVIPTLPLEDWGYVRYGIDVPVNIGSANFRQRFESEKSYSYNGTEKTVSYLPTIVNRGIPNSATANTPTRQLIFKAIALAMKDGDTITLKTILETLMFYFMDNGEQIIQNYAENYVLSESGLAEPLSYAETIEQLSIKSTKYLRETENMSQEEFSAWLNENHSEVEDLEQWAHYQIGSRKDLEDVWKIFEANSLAKITGFEGIDAGEAEALLECGVALWVYFHDGGSFSAIGDGHDWMSYLFYINEEYYGYRGWYKYAGNFGIQLSDDQNIETIGADCFSRSSIRNFTAEGNLLRYIGSNAFTGALDLSIADVGAGIERIGDYAFSYCFSLGTLYIPAGLAINNTTIFKDCTGLGKIYYTGFGEMAEHLRMVDDFNGANEQAILPWMDSEFPVEVVIEDGVISISDEAFYHDKNLRALTIGNGVTSIGKYAFSGALNLAYVRIGNNVVSIGARAFAGCTSLTELTIPDSVTVIGDVAFAGCGLTAFTIPDSVTSFGTSVFSNCTQLTTVTLGSGIPGIPGSTFSNCFKLTGLTIPTNIGFIGNSAFSYCSGLTELTIPNSVSSIGDSLCYQCSSLKSCIISEKVTSIGEKTFFGCSALETLSMPAAAAIGNDAFNMCTGITTVHLTGTGMMAEIPYGEKTPWTWGSEGKHDVTVVIHNGVKSICESAFRDCQNLVSVSIPESITEIGANAFYGCSRLLSGIVIGSNVKSIGDHAFEKCAAITELTLSHGVSAIGNSAFYNCTGLKGTLVIPDSVTFIGHSAFYGCSGLTELTIPNSVASIEEYTFYGCSGLTELTIPDSVTSIGHYAFYGCSGLTELTIPNSVTSIEEYTFYECDSLTELTMPAAINYFDSSFGECKGVSTVHLTGSGEMGTCRNSSYSPNSQTEGSQTPWKYASEAGVDVTIILDEGITSISPYAFGGCENLVNLTIPHSVVSIGDCAFYGCSRLMPAMIIPDTVVSIGLNAFTSCPALKELTIPDGVTRIESNAFSECSGLVKVTIPDSVTSIGYDAFYGCSGLTELTIPNSVTSIEEYAFYGCSGLTELTIPNSVTSIEKYTFNGCSGLTKLTIPDSVTSIGYGAFYGCSGLTELTIPNSVTSIEEYAFYGCSGLTELTIPDSVTSIGGWAFYDCTGLESIFMKGRETDSPTIHEDAFWNCGSPTFYVYAGSASEKYASDHFWFYRPLNVVDEATFPDALFRAYVLDVVDIDGNEILDEGECSAVKSLDFSGSASEPGEISTLNGVELFDNLETLNCAYNRLTELRLHSPLLRFLDCSNNQLTDLDNINAYSLKSLNCSNNQLTRLSSYVIDGLTELNCANNLLSGLNCSSFTCLETLDCSYNQLTSLTTDNLSSITSFNCSHNQLRSLNLSGCTVLQSLDFSHNQIWSLSLSGCTALQSLDFSHNQIWSFSAPDSVLLRELDCSYNQLLSFPEDVWPELRMLNCANNSITDLELSGYPLLAILQCEGNTLNRLKLVSLPGIAALVNDTAPKVESGHLLYTDGSSMLTVDPGVTLITSVHNVVPLDASHFPDVVFRDALAPYDTDGDGIFTNLELSEIQGIYLRGDIASLCGIEHLSFLSALEIYEAKLQSVDLSNNQTLQDIRFTNCPLLTSLDVSGCPRLAMLICNKNALMNLNLSRCPAIEQIYCYDNQLEALDLSSCPELMCLYCYNNLLTTLDLSHCPILNSVAVAVEPEYAEWAEGYQYHSDLGQFALDTGVELIAPALKLPGFLTAIESEAFVNTDVSVVIIPPTVTEIADDAFSQVYVVGVEGSEAEAYAARKGFKFVSYEK